MSTGTTKMQVLLRVQALLLKSLTPITDQVIIVVEDLIPQTRPKFVITISMPGGTFDYAGQVGGGSKVLHYQGTLRVSIWNINRTDQNGSDKNILTADNTGLFRIEQRILRALVGSLLEDPDIGSGDMILNQEIYAMSDSSVQRMDDEATGAKTHGANSRATMSMDFGIDFKIDLNLD